MKLSIFLFFAYVISLHIPTTQTLSISGYGIKDLEGIDSASLQTEADWWNLTSNVSHAKITQTTNTFQWILGGPNILGGRDSANPLPAFFRTYTNLPTHSFVGISLEMWYFDLNDVTWYNNIFRGVTFEFDEIQTRFEGSVRFSIFELGNRIDGPLLRKDTDFVTEDGGENEKADLRRANTKFGFLSESSELTLKILSHDTQGHFFQSAGFRGLHIHLSNYSGPIPALCHRSQDLDSLSHQQCKCPINQARDSDGNCVSCAANCDVCFGPAAEECLACSEGAYWDGSQCNTCHLMCQTCTGTTSNECPSCKYGFYNYGNNTCMESCELPFVAEKRGTELFCLPLCPASQFYWPLNQTCLNKCDFPLVHAPDENGIEYCLNPCEGTTKYLYANGSCLDSCKAPLILRKDLNIKFCINPCPPTSYLFSNNGSCLSSCPFPLMSRSEPGAQYCSNPCPSASYFLFNNGSCEKTCPAPLISRFESGVKYCYTPCDSVDEFIYDNRSCGNSCSLPLVSRTEPLVARYCSNPCLANSNSFLYPNGSCFAGCSWPLKNRTESGAKYCYSSCSSSSEYIYLDGSCDNKCPSPLLARVESDFNYCLSPCTDSSQYLYSDQSCQNTCKSPLIKRLDKSGIKHCDTPCDESEYVYQDGTCRPKCGYPFRVLSHSAYKICSMNIDEIKKSQAHSLARGTDIANTFCGIGGLLTGFVTPGDPTSMLMWSLLKMLQFTKYMDVNFPGQMTLIFTRQNDNYNEDGDMSSTGSGRILNSQDRDLGKFTSYGVPHSFLENYWQQLIIFAVLIILIAILWLLSKLIKNPKYLRICMNLKSALQWNVLVMFFCGSYGELVLYSAIEFQTVSFESTGSMMSFVICLFMVTLAIYLPIKIAYVLKVIRDAKSAFGEKDAEKQWSHNRVFFEAYKSDQFIQHMFLFIYLIRVALFNIIIGYIFKSPLAQALLINLLSFGMLAYLLLKTPIKDKFCFYQQVLMESMLFVYNLCILILVILDLAGAEVESTRAFFGGLMVVVLIVGPVGMAVLIISKLFLRLRDFYDQFRAQKEIEKRVKSAFRFKKAQNNGSFTIGNDETLNLSHSGINGIKPAGKILPQAKMDTDESHLVVIPNEKEEVSPWYSIPTKKNKLAAQEGGSENLRLQKNFVESLIVEIYAKKESNSKSRKVSVFKNDDYLPD